MTLRGSDFDVVRIPEDGRLFHAGHGHAEDGPLPFSDLTPRSSTVFPQVLSLFCTSTRAAMTNATRREVASQRLSLRERSSSRRAPHGPQPRPSRARQTRCRGQLESRRAPHGPLTRPSRARQTRCRGQLETRRSPHGPQTRPRRAFQTRSTRALDEDTRRASDEAQQAGTENKETADDPRNDREKGETFSRAGWAGGLCFSVALFLCSSPALSLCAPRSWLALGFLVEGSSNSFSFLRDR